MTRYGGTKALDAEIKIDFSSNTVLMDYSTVKGNARYDSNRAVVLSSEWKDAPILTRLKYATWITALMFIKMFGVIGLYTIYFTYLANHGIIKSADAQYDHQRLLQYFYSYLYGTKEETVSGECKEDKIVFHFWNNLYLDYELYGDYREKITSISLVRRYVHIKRFGVFAETRQNGWNLIFGFSEPPKNGYCIVRSVG